MKNKMEEMLTERREVTEWWRGYFSGLLNEDELTGIEVGSGSRLGRIK